jgi:predicted TIM-barrel fold metal-dependent hydrolase
MPKQSVIDVHCHLFNAPYAIMELAAVTWNALWGNYPHAKAKTARRKAAGVRRGLGPLRAIEGAVELAAWIARLVKAGLSDVKGNHATEEEAFKKSTLFGDSPLISVPLMMDIYFALDDNGDEAGPVRRGAKREAASSFAISSAETANFEQHLEWVKQMIRDEMGPTKTTRRSARGTAKSDALDTLFEEAKKDLLAMAPAQRRRGATRKAAADVYAGIEMSPGYKKHLRDLETLQAMAPDLVYPFLAIDPRRVGIMKLIEMKVNKGNGPFRGVKVYPPLGYLPTHPNLTPVYDYCVRYDIPITSHTSPGGLGNFRRKNYVRGSGGPNEWVDFKKANLEKSRYYADPKNWLPILNQWPTLRINLAHFGGGLQLSQGDERWMKIIRDILKARDRYPNVYADFSYYSQPGLRDTLKQLVTDTPELAGSLMFGTDFIMIMLERTLGGLSKYFDNLAGLEDRLYYENAKAFLKL